MATRSSALQLLWRLLLLAIAVRPVWSELEWSIQQAENVHGDDRYYLEYVWKRPSSVETVRLLDGSDEGALMSNENAGRMLRYVNRFDTVAACQRTILENDNLWRCPLPSDLWDSFATGDDLSKIYNRPDLTKDEETLVQLMSDNFFKWYLEDDKAKLAKFHLVKADPITEFLAQAFRQGKGADFTKAARKLLLKNDYKGQDITKDLNLWQSHYTMSDNFLGMLKAIPGSQGLMNRMTKLDGSRLEMLVNFKRNDALSVTDIYQGLQDTSKSGQAATAAAASLGIGGVDRGFASRGFIYVIYSQSGRILSLLNSKAEYREVLFVEGIAGEFKVLGYQKLLGFKDKQKIYKEGHYAVFWLMEAGVGIKDNKKLLSDLKKEVKL
ncbi:Uu.00g099680.m01.CDS01 [Anthostomella pinea]|uniref:Uu.00g099680.m01.CDS01 n=1 Tax=Anthostomella pinea TaxID=933095 RepID=A0AAI8YCU9_9PEZI|nr:Uu.00g099680.m01.CDS01 [Anthostomella pinea]